jgi:hypothetical protein
MKFDFEATARHSSGTSQRDNRRLCAVAISTSGKKWNAGEKRGRSGALKRGDKNLF